MKKLYIFIFLWCLTSAVNAQNCTIVDKPDIYYNDENGDGIDGDTSAAIFVSASTGNDLNNGRIGTPVKSLTMAMVLANGSSKDIYVAAGTYTLSAPLILFDGVSIYGGYSAGTWARNKFSTVIVYGVENVIYAKGNIKNSTIADIEWIAGDASTSSKSSNAVIIDSCSGLITFIGNTFRSGYGANGSDGVDGSFGANGGNGGDGTVGDCDDVNAGSGGNAGSSACSPGSKGGNGGVYSAGGFSGATTSAGLTGGSGGSSGDPGQKGVDGKDGTNGNNGSSALVNSTQYEIGNSGCTGGAGLDGIDGTNGTGGSGGGGGGGQDCALCDKGSGNGGGGGAGGACKGSGGKGGKGGGSSLGIFIRDSKVYLENNKIFTKNGGNGGSGGNGGKGGDGGTGGSGATLCPGEIGSGGKGGNGGNGGNGGAGSGGNGGLSVGVFVTGNSSVSGILNSYTIGMPGNGGNGGTAISLPAGSSGIAGLAQNSIGTISGSEPNLNSDICIEDLKIARLENSENTGIITVALSNPNPKEIKVSYAFTNVTATEGSDFEFVNDQMSFLPYTTVQFIPFQIAKDNGDTSKKTFVVSLSNVIGNGTIDRSSATITILPFNVTDIKGRSFVNPYGFNVYPNPSEGKSYINFASDADVNYRVELFNINGQSVSVPFEGMCNGHQMQVQMMTDQMPSGVYFCRLYREGVAVSTVKVLVLP